MSKNRNHAVGSEKNAFTDCARLSIGTETDQLRKNFFVARSKDLKLGMLLKVFRILTNIVSLSSIIYAIKSIST